MLSFSNRFARAGSSFLASIFGPAATFVSGASRLWLANRPIALTRSLLVICCALILGLFAAVGIATAQTFKTPASYNVGANPNQGVTGDFNGDGKLDLAVGNVLGKSVGVLLNNGDGTFQTVVNYVVDFNPEAVAVGDFNADTKLDLAVGNFFGGVTSAGSISILLGNGDGTFMTAVNYASGRPLNIKVADLNGDGKLDLAAPGESTNQVSVLIGNGNGTFQTAVTYGVGTAPQGVAVADFNEDGKPDLAVVNNGSSNLSVLIGNGNGTFQAALNYATPAAGASIAASDLNGDGHHDLVIGGGGSAVVVFRGNGNATFQPGVPYLVGSAPLKISLGDLNGDGKTDVVVVNANNSSVSVLRGNGDCTFQPASTFAARLNSFSPVVGDFDTDGKLDLGILNNNFNLVDLYLNSPSAHSVAINATVSVPATLLVATFLDYDSSKTAGSFTATINWGDGSAATPGTVAVNGNGGFNVTGSHTYSALGSYNVNVQIADDSGNFAAVTSTATVVKADQTITVGTHAPSGATYNSGFIVGATANSGLPVSYSSAGACTNSGATFTMTSGTGICTVMYDQAGDGTHNAAPQVSESVTAQKAGQTITFGSLANKTYGDPDFSVNATATSTLTVTFAASGACTFSGGNVHLAGAGACNITASQSGNGNYSAAPDVQRSFNVADIISIDDVSTTEGDSGTKTADFTVSLAVASNLAVTVNYATANGTATATSDYLATSGTLTFNPGQMSKTISVTINGEQSFEPDETFVVNLSGATNSTISDNQGVGTIMNDDPKGGIIAFSLDMYTVSEDGRELIITVSRTGDTSASATVDYATGDSNDFIPCATLNGSASFRCDYTTAAGTLAFAAGETSKTFSVLISQDSYAEGDETFQVTLLNPTGGAVFGVPATATVRITDDLTEPATNPIDDAGAFVRQHYHDFLNREGDPGGQDFWTGRITTCGNDPACIRQQRIGVSASFFIELEFQQTGFYVYRAFKGALGRRLSYAEFVNDRSRLQASPNLVAEQAAYTLEFVQRSEFTSRYAVNATSSTFVDALIQTVRDNSGVDLIARRSELITEYGTGTNQTDSRARTLRKLVDYDEFKAVEYNRAFVLAQYFGYLRRGPDTAGYDFWVSVLNSNPSNFQGMVCAFITSGEYQDRFGAAHTHSNFECNSSPGGTTGGLK